MAVCTAMALCTSCSEDDTDTSDAFDRSLLLTDVADRLIVPAYTRLQNSVGNLAEKTDQFVNAPDADGLLEMREAWVLAYTDWQYANAYNFGPAGEQGLRRGLIEEVGTWPISVSKVESAIESGTWNLNDFNRDARGFLAVEYLIYGYEMSDEGLIQLFENQLRRDFLAATVGDIHSRITEVLNAWNGAYRSEFIASNNTSAGSSISMFYNEFVRSYEALKNFKVGLPLGLRPGQVQAEPQLVEAYYSAESIAMFTAHLRAIEDIWYGRDRDGNQGLGFEAYLASVTGGPELIAATIEQLNDVNASMAAIPETPSAAEQIQTAPQALDNFHTQLQMHTRFFKSDMSSLLGITITFSSGDGD